MTTRSLAAPPADEPARAAHRLDRAAAVRAGREWLRGWPAVAQLAVDLFLSLPYLLFGAGVLVGFVAIPAALLGVPVLFVLLQVGYGLGAMERARLAALLGVAVPPPGPLPDGWSPARRLLLDPRRWKALAFVLVLCPWGALAGALVVGLAGVGLALTLLPLYVALIPGAAPAMPWGEQVHGVPAVTLLALGGVLALVAVPFAARALVQVDVLLGRRLLGPGRREEVQRLAERVETLDRTRVATVDSVELERRRIERDLHDGPQQRLVAIAMDLGMAREKLGTDEDGARELLDQAHAAAKDAITDMRQVARGIHPPVLTDRGLPAALSALAARCPVPVELHVDVPRRPSPAIEAIAYFSVSEALTNVAKHSAARAARVDVAVLNDGRGEQLGVHVSDNGVGGADAARGTGLNGLADRARSVDGTFEVSSPPGGPTALTVLLPLTIARPEGAES